MAAVRTDRSVAHGHQSQRGLNHLRADDGADDPRAVAVVLRVVGRVERLVHIGARLLERDVALDAAGPDAPDAAGLRTNEPRIARPVRGAHVEVVTRADDPDRHIGPQRAVAPPRGDLQLLGAADAVEVFGGPRAHRWSSRSLLEESNTSAPAIPHRTSPDPAGTVKTSILIVVSPPARQLSPGELDLQLVLALVAELHLHLEVDLVGDAHGDLPSRAVELDRVVLR